MRKKTDYLIIGQGLAGSSVAIHLLKRGKTIMVFDEFNPNAASRIAAGLFNPITGKYMTKTWLADLTFAYLQEYYPMVESMTGRHFYYPEGVFHPFRSIREQNEWMGRSSEPAFQKFIRSVSTSPERPGIRDEFGGVMFDQAGYINTGVYLEAVRDMLIEKESFSGAVFHDEELIVNTKGIAYRDWEADRIIFCTGTQALLGKWFQGVPIISLKGETLRIKGIEIGNHVTNRGVYIVPQGSAIYNIGSTYKLAGAIPGVTTEGRAELIEKLNMVIDFPYEIVGQDWGMRPTTRDRRPIIGVHPANDRLVYFNGLGTKGVSISPYFGREITNWLENSAELHPEVQISRFKFVN